MPRLASGDEKPPMSAEARRWWPAPMERDPGGRSELEPSGVLFLLAAMLDMVMGCWLGRWAGDVNSDSLVSLCAGVSGVSGRQVADSEAWGGKWVRTVC